MDELEQLAREHGMRFLIVPASVADEASDVTAPLRDAPAPERPFCFADLACLLLFGELWILARDVGEVVMQLFSN